MTTRFGVFGEARAIGIGDPYVDTARPDARDRGLVSVKVPGCSKSGKVRGGQPSPRAPARSAPALVAAQARRRLLTPIARSPAPPAPAEQ
jgi:hypothetical protein